MNKAMVIGNLGSDPEVRYTQNRHETPVATFSVASTERWKDSDGNKQERTEWHRVVAWGKLAEICGEHLNKGDKVFIEGKLRTRKWEDQKRFFFKQSITTLPFIHATYLVLKLYRKEKINPLFRLFLAFFFSEMNFSFAVIHLLIHLWITRNILPFFEVKPSWQAGGTFYKFL